MAAVSFYERHGSVHSRLSMHWVVFYGVVHWVCPTLGVLSACLKIAARRERCFRFFLNISSMGIGDKI
jgi:hypothetical protein